MCCVLDLIPENTEIFGDLKAKGLGSTDQEMIKFRVQRGGGIDRKQG